MESDEPGTSSSLISIDENSTVILPVTAAFTDANPSIVLEKQGDEEKAFLKYEFAGQTVGKAPIRLEQTSKDSGLSKNDSDGIKNEGTKFITINLKVVFIILLIIVLLAAIVLLIRNFFLENRTKIRKAVNIYRKKQFLRRRSHRRNRNRRHL